MDLIKALNWRYAVKKMNGKQVPQEKVDNILEAIRLSASSAGLQPYLVVVVSDHVMRGKIHAQACQQPQVVEGSHFLVFASLTNLSSEYIDEQINRMADHRNVDISTLTPFSDSIKGSLLVRPAEVNAQWAARQAYIGLGFGLVAAALEEVDATPMEGFNGELMDEILGLKERGLKSVVVMALGYRDEEKDFLAKAKKVRKTTDELFIKI